MLMWARPPDSIFGRSAWLALGVNVPFLTLTGARDAAAAFLAWRNDCTSNRGNASAEQHPLFSGRFIVDIREALLVQKVIAGRGSSRSVWSSRHCARPLGASVKKPF
jgi:hypothetical protein